MDSSPSELDPLDHRGLVRTIVGDYRRRGVDLDDLVQEGFIGLMWACERYDGRGGTPFPVFASRLINQAIRMALARYAFPVRLPRYLYRLRAGIHHGRIDPEADLGAAQRARLREATPFFDPFPPQVDRGQLAVLAVVPEEGATDADEIPRLLRAVADLPPRHRDVIRLRYGLDGRAPMTQAGTSTEVGRTRQRVHQLEWEAIGKLRETLADRARA